MMLSFRSVLFLSGAVAAIVFLRRLMLEVDLVWILLLFTDDLIKGVRVIWGSLEFEKWTILQESLT